MNIDELTLGQIKQIQAMASGVTKSLPPTGRVVLVVDRGWIFAGDLSSTADGYLRLDSAVHVLRWESIGFARMVKEWKTDKVIVAKCDSVEVPADAVVFRVPVEAGWGLK